MSEDLSNIFEEADKYLHVALSRWKKQLPELWEDAMQEGMIQVWRDVEAGVTPKLKILRRASMAANKFMHRNGEYFFGKPRKSRDGLRTNTKTVEKVQIYLEEILPVRGGVYPTATEVADALGISRTGTVKILKDIREGRVDHMKYRPDGRMDWDYYSTISVEVLSVQGSTGGEVRHWTDDTRIPSETWEEDLISNLNVTGILNKLNDHHRQILYLVLYEGYTAGDIGRHLGFTTNISTKGDRNVKAALNQARMLIDPYEGECQSGHVRTPETCHIKQRRDGVYLRVCDVCRSEAGAKTAAKQRAVGFKTGRKEKLECPRGHIKDMRDSRGCLRCSQCRKDAQKRYYDNHKEYYQEYQKDYYQKHRKES